MASESMMLSYALDTKTMAKAMGFAGAQLQKSPPPGVKRKQYIFFALAVVTLVAAGLVFFHGFGIDIWGAGFIVGIVWAVGAFFLMQRVAIEGLAESVVETAMKRGDIRLTISPGGLSEQSGIGRMDIVWDVVDDIEGLAGATVIRFGGMCMAVPDTALPDGMAPEQFREKLISWREASEVFG